MTSNPKRDPLADHLITPQNATLILIDYQPAQFGSIRSMDADLLLKNIVSTVKTAKAFGLPIIHSTVGVAAGRGQPTVPELAELLVDSPAIDRSSINSWEDADFVAAVRATGRRKLILCALWTEVCMAFPALDALKEGSTSILLSTRSLVPPSKRIVLAWSGSFRLEPRRSVGSPSRASYNVTGLE